MRFWTCREIKKKKNFHALNPLLKPGNSTQFQVESLLCCSSVPWEHSLLGIAADNLWSPNRLSFVFSHLSFHWGTCPQAVLQAEGGKKCLNKRNSNTFSNGGFRCNLKWVAPNFKMLAFIKKANNTIPGKDSRSRLVQNAHFAHK